MASSSFSLSRKLIYHHHYYGLSSSFRRTTAAAFFWRRTTMIRPCCSSPGPRSTSTSIRPPRTSSSLTSSSSSSLLSWRRRVLPQVRHQLFTTLSTTTTTHSDGSTKKGSPQQRQQQGTTLKNDSTSSAATAASLSAIITASTSTHSKRLINGPVVNFQQIMGPSIQPRAGRLYLDPASETGDFACGEINDSDVSTPYASTSCSSGFSLSLASSSSLSSGSGSRRMLPQQQQQQVHPFTTTSSSSSSSNNGGSQQGASDTSSSSAPLASLPANTNKNNKKRLIKGPVNLRQLMGPSIQPRAGRLYKEVDTTDTTMTETEHNDSDSDHVSSPYSSDSASSNSFIPQIPLYDGDGRSRKRVLMLCTGGTLTMAPDPNWNGALAPVQGALSKYMEGMTELTEENSPRMPEVVLHEYHPFVDSSDLGPADWARLAQDIRDNYLHFDGFVVITGTDTMAYCATALSFMLENLGKPVVFTGSQIPLCEPYNDGRRNLIMALIFASRDTINEVTIFFHDRLLRACRATKVNTHRLMAFDSPNQDPLATIGITIDENEHLILPPARGALRVHSRMDTRLLTLRLVPGFDDAMIRDMIERNFLESDSDPRMLRALVLQLYGTGNLPSVKQSFIQLLADASERGILVVASTQCFTGCVMMGQYAVGQALSSAGVVSANDMTLEAIACKVAYLCGRGDLNHKEVANLMGVSLRGEITPLEALSPPPLSTSYQRGMRKGKKYY